MKPTTLILFAILGVAGYMLYKTLKGASTATTSVSSAGSQVSAKENLVNTVASSVGSIFEAAFKTVATTTPKTS